ncbi:hypothetical protein BA187_10150 [Serratia marcescens]|nr:hypothetical protein BA187_10150 [Serratia marcescens]
MNLSGYVPAAYGDFTVNRSTTLQYVDYRHYAHRFLSLIIWFRNSLQPKNMGVMAMLLAAVQSTSRNHRIGATFIAAD